MNESKNERIFYFDCIRAFAISLVVLIHMSGGFMAQKIGSSAWFIGGFYDSLARPGVPLFLMISGALLLSRYADISIGKFFYKRFFKVFLPFAAWSIIYFVFRFYFLNENLGNFQSIIQKFLAGGAYYHLGYFYYLIPLYFTVPFLAPLIKGHDKEMRYFLFTWFIFTSMGPLIFSLLGWTSGFSMELFTGFLGIFLAGYGLSNGLLKRIQEIRIRWLLVMSFTMVLLTLAGTYVLSLKSGTLNETFFNYTTPNIFILTITYFLIIKKINWSVVKNKFLYFEVIIKSLSMASFGIYLIHPIVMMFVFKYFPNLLNIKPYTIILIPFLTLLILSISCIVVSLLRKIPILKVLVP